VLCTLALTDAADTVTATALVRVAALLAVTDAADSLAGTASVSQPEAAEVVSLGGRDKLRDLLRFDDVPSWPVLVRASLRDEDDRLAGAAALGLRPILAGLMQIDDEDPLRASYSITWPKPTLRRSTRLELIRVPG
jgi:hypothetical protein